MWTSNQLMNFCDPVFKTEVICDTVCCEGYDVTNLVSSDTQKRRCGFLSDRFIKPPVEVTLKFPFEISLSHLQIVTQVGQQKSSGLEVLSSYVTNNRNCGFRGSGSSMTEKIGFVNVEHFERGVVFFCPQLHGRQWSHPEAKLMKMKAFTWIQRGSIIHVSKLTIRILRTFGSSVPGIGSIEVWGVPSSCMPRFKMDEVKALWKSTKKPHDSVIDKEPLEKKDIQMITRKNISEEFALDQIPEDFLDAITYEVMALPMVLPSGKIVDQQTLEHHANAEACWGRPPSDPFTGISFRKECQPVLDVALKGRIDRFLVMNQNREDLKMVPRTVGRGCLPARTNDSQESTHTAGISSLLNSCRRFGSKRHISSELNKISWTSSSKSISESSTRGIEASCGSVSAKKIKIDKGACHQPTSISVENTPDLNCISSPPGSNDVTKSSSNVVNKTSHEEKLNKSLESAIEAALSGLPSFVNPAPTKINVRDCGSCKESKNLFSLPCNHYLCRNCLILVTKQSKSACPKCDSVFESSGPVRCHD